MTDLSTLKNEEIILCSDFYFSSLQKRLLVYFIFTAMIIDQAKKKNPDLENVFFLKNGDVVFKSDIIDKAQEKRRQEEANAAKAKSNPKKGDKRPPEKDVPHQMLEVLSVTSEDESKFQSAKKSNKSKHISVTPGGTTETSKKKSIGASRRDFSR